MTEAELKQRAAELGLERLLALAPADLERALKNAAALAERLPPDIHWTEEPAHIFSLAPRREAKS
ncbi:MAG: hypothetical protein R3D67_17925 [Hyphomicrobiaceae bacterium]